MKIVSDILSRVGIAQPDGRPIYAYEVTPDEHAQLGQMLQWRIAMGGLLPSTAQGFVVWAAEHIRTRFAGGQLTWEFVFGALGLEYERDAAVSLTQQGLQFWRRPLRRGDAGHREFLFSILAEGGLPDLALAQAPRYRQVLLGLIHEIEAEGVLGSAMAEAAAFRSVAELPQVMRTDEQARLLAELAVMIVAARASLPEGLPDGAAEAWLDVNRAGWRQSLPLRLSAKALEALVRPALAAARPDKAGVSVPVTRQLRRTATGQGWSGAAIIAENARIATAMMPGGSAGLQLRLVAENGAGFLAVPSDGGWDLMRRAGRGDLVLDQAPDVAVTMSVYADGRTLGDVVLDPGLPRPDDAPSLWRPQDPVAPVADVLEPLSGRGQTRGARVYALANAGVVPEGDAGICVGSPEPGPGGNVWPLWAKG